VLVLLEEYIEARGREHMDIRLFLVFFIRESTDPRDLAILRCFFGESCLMVVDLIYQMARRNGRTIKNNQQGRGLPQATRTRSRTERIKNITRLEQAYSKGRIDSIACCWLVAGCESVQGRKQEEKIKA
jgi:hypothetical protein